MHCLCILEHNDPAGEDVGAIAGVLSAFASLNNASNTRNALDQQMKASVLRDVAEARAWLWDGRGAPWLSELPPADLEQAINSYWFKPSADDVDNVISKLKQCPVDNHPLLRTNAEGICTLVFPTSSSTASIATWLSCIRRRMEEDCGRDFPWANDDDECALYRRLMQCILRQGYARVDGTTGMTDETSGLPLVFGASSHHPLSAALGAHVAHGQPLRLSGPGTNHMVCSWAANRSTRTTPMISDSSRVRHSRPLPDRLYREGCTISSRCPDV